MSLAIRHQIMILQRLGRRLQFTLFDRIIWLFCANVWDHTCCLVFFAETSMAGFDYCRGGKITAPRPMASNTMKYNALDGM